MHNFVVRGLSFVGATAMFSVVCMAPCAEDIQPLATAATSDYIQSGLYTGELLREVNSIIGNTLIFLRTKIFFVVLIPTLKRQHFRVLLQWLVPCCSVL